MNYSPDIPGDDVATSLDRSLGPAQGRLLLLLAEHLGSVFTIEQARRVLSGEGPHLRRRLNELVAKGWVFSLGRGAYMIAPLEAGPDSREYAINRYLAASAIAGDREHYLSYRSAMELQGMTVHPWRTVYVSTASRLRRREIQGFTVKPVTVPPARLWGATTVEAVPDHRVKVSSQSRTIVDCLDRPPYAGGVKDVALGLALLGGDFVAEHAVDAALRFGKISVIKRLGVLVESVVPDQGAVVARLLSYVNDTPHVLDPGLPREGRLNSRWGIWMNIPEDELRQDAAS